MHGSWRAPRPPLPAPCPPHPAPAAAAAPCAQLLDGKTYEGIFNTAVQRGGQMHIVLKQARELVKQIDRNSLAERPVNAKLFNFSDVLQIRAEDVCFNAQDLRNDGELRTDEAIGRGRAQGCVGERGRQKGQAAGRVAHGGARASARARESPHARSAATGPHSAWHLAQLPGLHCAPWAQHAGPSQTLRARGMTPTPRPARAASLPRSTVRDLTPWMPDADEAAPHLSLDDGGGTWDQFAVNRDKFGVETTFKEELYTTALDKRNCGISEAEAARIAREIESQGTTNYHLLEERGGEVDGGDQVGGRAAGVGGRGRQQAGRSSAGQGGRGGPCRCRLHPARLPARTRARADGRGGPVLVRAAPQGRGRPRQRRGRGAQRRRGPAQAGVGQRGLGRGSRGQAPAGPAAGRWPRALRRAPAAAAAAAARAALGPDGRPGGRCAPGPRPPPPPHAAPERPGPVPH